MCQDDKNVFDLAVRAADDPQDSCPRPFRESC